MMGRTSVPVGGTATSDEVGATGCIFTTTCIHPGKVRSFRWFLVFHYFQTSFKFLERGTLEGGFYKSVARSSYPCRHVWLSVSVVGSIHWVVINFHSFGNQASRRFHYKDCGLVAYSTQHFQGQLDVQYQLPPDFERDRCCCVGCESFAVFLSCLGQYYLLPWSSFP